ncbi:MAG TPA: ABC transporter ATP-binding protein [Dehalococcoidia bacterium]|nr:ABC transporter ATP-binding protein [Dehalococcoidia bacterium]
MLEIRDLTLSYGERLALRDVSLSLAKGELLGVVGPNASGKSSLIRAITDVVTPQCGEVRLGGSLVRRLSRREMSLRVAVVPQNPSLPEAFTALEVVLMGRTPHLGLLQSERRADWAAVRRALEQTDALELAERRIGELSGGERQRVVVARALAQEAPLLLLDEPTAHLDVGHQAAVLELLQRLCRSDGADGSPKAVLAVVHDLTLAAQYCDRLAMLSEGRLVALGSPQEVLLPQVVASVYRTQVSIFPHPVTGRPVVTPAANGAAPGGQSVYGPSGLMSEGR